MTEKFSAGSDIFADWELSRHWRRDTVCQRWSVSLAIVALLMLQGGELHWTAGSPPPPSPPPTPSCDPLRSLPGCPIVCRRCKPPPPPPPPSCGPPKCVVICLSCPPKPIRLDKNFSVDFYAANPQVAETCLTHLRNRAFVKAGRSSYQFPLKDKKKPEANKEADSYWKLDMGSMADVARKELGLSLSPPDPIALMIDFDLLSGAARAMGNELGIMDVGHATVECTANGIVATHVEAPASSPPK